jgi:ABC-type dipeptide/oligopeptide/nickel transport system ATPase component
MEYRSVRKEIRDYMYKMVTYCDDGDVMAWRLSETRIAFDLFTSLYETVRQKEVEIENLAAEKRKTMQQKCSEERGHGWTDAERVKVEALIAKAEETVRDERERERQVTFYKHSLASAYDGSAAVYVMNAVDVLGEDQVKEVLRRPVRLATRAPVRWHTEPDYITTQKRNAEDGIENIRMDKIGMYFQEYVYQLTEFIHLRLTEKTMNWAHVIRDSHERLIEWRKQQEEQQQQDDGDE